MTAPLHAGGQAGYNWANCSTFWGVEFDGSWVGVKNTFNENPNGGGTSNSIVAQMDSLMTARLRTGVTLDSLAFYVTGGLAAAHFRTTWTDLPDSVQFKEWRLGWVAGLGTEYAWSRNWSFKSEILYANFMDRDRSTVLGGTPFSFRHSDSVWISKIGVNYRWGN